MTFDEIKNIKFNESQHNDNSIVILGNCLDNLKKIEEGISLIDEFVPLKENADEAFAEAVRQNHSVYDMFYLTLVRRSAGTLFSLDKKLVNLCVEMKLDCVEEVAL